MRLQLHSLLVLLALWPALSYAQQSNQTNGTCSSCEQLFVVTGKNLWRFDASSNNLTVCAANFSDAKGVAVDANGNIFVADEGARAIYMVSANCTSNKTLVVQNDDNSTSWLYPHDLTVDDENNLYVAMSDYDPLWPMYSVPRKILAKERHVYKLKLDDSLTFTGDVSILAGGIGNGRDIFHVKWVKGEGLWGTRQNRYVVRFVDNLWEDWLGPNNDFRIKDPSPFLLGARKVDVAFERCGFLALAADANNQFFSCSNKSDVSSCNSTCESQSDSQNTSLTIDESGLFVREECISDDCIEFEETTFTFSNSSLSSSLASNATCQGMMVPYSVLIDCSCSLLVGDIGSQQIFFFNSTNNSTDSSNSNNATMVQLNEPPYGMVFFLPSNCTNSTS